MDIKGSLAKSLTYSPTMTHVLLTILKILTVALVTVSNCSLVLTQRTYANKRDHGRHRPKEFLLVGNICRYSWQQRYSEHWREIPHGDHLERMFAFRAGQLITSNCDSVQNMGTCTVNRMFWSHALCFHFGANTGIQLLGLILNDE